MEEESVLKETEGHRGSSRSLRSLFTKGLTWRSLLALGYIVFVFQPGLAYLNLMTGMSVASSALAGAIQWATILLFIEVCSMTGNPLTMNEAIIIYLASGQTLKYWWFLAPEVGALSHPGWIYQAWFKYNTIVGAQTFGIFNQIPAFYSPSYATFIARTFFSPDWTPILMNTIAFYVAAMFGDICLTIVAYILYVRVENLPYPTAPPVVQATETLIQKDWKRLGVLAATSSFAAIYGFALYVMPLLARVLWNTSVSVLPVPWFDFNTSIQQVLPGGSFGIATDLSLFALGFIIPFRVSLGLLIGSLGLYLFGNYILVTNNITDFASRYTYGLTLQTAWQWSTLYAWAMPIIGLGIAVGVMPLILHPSLITRTFGTLKRLKTESPLGFPIWWIVLPFIAGTIGLSIYDWWLAPDISILILIFLNLIWPFACMLIVARANALGVNLSVPYIREMTFKSTGYSGINAWFVPLYSPTPYADSFKICDMTKTKLTDYILAQYIIFPIALVFGFFFMQAFWSLAPIPSSVYPGVQMTWPIIATFQGLFVSPQAAQYFVTPRILYGFLVGAAMYVVGDRLGFASTVVGIAGGAASPIPNSVSIFIGAVIAQIFIRRMGKDFWNRYRGIIFAGVLLGEGLIVCVGAAIAIISKGMWAAPY
jgi:hypothetical protein